MGPAPAIPQTDAALSPRLLEILQYHEPTHRRTLSDTTPLGDDRNPVADGLPERPSSTVGYQSTKQYAADGIIQRLGAPGQDRSVPARARSETLDTIDTAVFFPTPSPIPHHENSNQVPNLGGSTLSPRESSANIPKISVHTVDSVPGSDASSFTVVDNSEYQHAMLADSTRTNRRAHDSGNSRGAGDVRSDRGLAPDSGSNRGDSNVRKASDASSRKTESQQHGTPGQRDLHGPLAPTPVKPGYGTAVLGLQPLVQTPSRSSSIRRKGKRSALCMQPCRSFDPNLTL